MNNLNSRFFFLPACELLSAGIILIACTLSAAGQSFPDISAKKQFLTEQIDSLDLEKQNLKRNGQSISDIEEYQSKLRDTLKSLRFEIQSQTPSVSTKPAKEQLNLKDLFNLKNRINFKEEIKKYFLLKPHGFFDWIIIIIGSIASLSGIILIIGIIKTLFGKKNRKTRQKKTNPRIAAAYSKSIKSEYPKPVQPDTTSIDPLARLRHRMENDSKQEISPAPTFNIPNSTAPNQSADHLSSDIESRIIQASKEGLDIHEISRRLHVGTDQVALILKVLNKNQPK